MFSFSKRKNSNSPSKIVWSRFIKNKPARFGLGVIVLMFVIAILGSTIRPDGSPNSNRQIHSIAKKAPGFKCNFIKVRKNQAFDEPNILSSLFLGGKEDQYKWIPINSYTVFNDTVTIEEYDSGGVGRVFSFSINDVLFNIDADNNWQKKNKAPELEKVSILEKNNIVSTTFWLGTDRFGRGILSRLMAGTIISLSVGFISVLISLLIGIVLGALAGYYKGWVDSVIMWFINVMWSVPTLLMVIAISFALGKGFWQIFIAVGLTMWVEVARVVRGQVLALREREFIEASTALGYTNWRVVFKHIVPNTTGPIIVISAANFATAILMEAGLSFLGIGVQPPMPSWGTMIKNHYAYITIPEMSHLAIFPGLSIMLLVVSFMLVGNGLRDALDVRES